MDRLELVSDIIKKTLKLGATEADAIIIDSANNSTDVRLGKPVNIEYSQDESIGIRVIINKQQAIVSTSDFTQASIDRIIERAIAMAKVVPSNPFLSLADNEQLCKNIRNLDLYDQEEPSTELLLETASIAESFAMKNKAITNSDGSSAGFTKNKIIFATSSGFIHEYQTSYFSVSTSVVAGRDENMQTDYSYTTARFWQNLRSAEQIGIEAADRAAAKLFPKKINSAELPVIFENRVARTLLSSFLSAINGAAVSRGTSFLGDCLNTQIFSSKINIIDDPFIIRGIGSRPFDAEGLEGEKLKLVENGVLKNFLLDLQTANKLKMTSNARAVRGLASIPGPSSTNCFIEAGNNSLMEAIKNIKKGLFITSTFGHGANIVTGEYSQGASGFYIENGEILYPVSEITIAGNLKDIFKNITALNDLEMDRSINSPSLLVERMTIAGV